MTLTVRLPDTIESQLSQYCDTIGLSKSQVVQSALRDWFAKPHAAQNHPLLAFVETAAGAASAGDWAGPYSKDRLRQRVLASGGEYRLAEPEAPDIGHSAQSKDANQLLKRPFRSRVVNAKPLTKSNSNSKSKAKSI